MEDLKAVCKLTSGDRNKLLVVTSADGTVAPSGGSGEQNSEQVRQKKI